MNAAPGKRLFLKVIACEIAFREISYLAAQSPHVLDLEFLTQGHHDVPNDGREDIQRRIHAAPAGRYDAILIGYGLCSNMLLGLTTAHTPLVIPRAHDCITFFLGSKERYRQHFDQHPGTYYYTSGWLECRQRRGLPEGAGQTIFLPANSGASVKAAYDQWVRKYGEDQARYLMEVLGSWSEGYTHGVLIDFDFTKDLALEREVRDICAQRGWQYEAATGDLGLLRRWINGQWDTGDFLVVPPKEAVVATYDDTIIGSK
jgi:hypothetical protein